MNDIKIFSNTEFGELGIMLIDGEEYFPATQCAKILGYSNPRDAIQKRCKKRWGRKMRRHRQIGTYTRNEEIGRAHV